MNKGQGLTTVLTHTGVQTDTHRHTLSWSAAASKYSISGIISTVWCSVTFIIIYC